MKTYKDKVYDETYNAIINWLGGKIDYLIDESSELVYDEVLKKCGNKNDEFELHLSNACYDITEVFSEMDIEEKLLKMKDDVLQTINNND